MNKNDWNPDLYLKFNKERIQPSIDLVSRIDYSTPKRILDIGCGPGNSTQILHARWPDSEIVGADKSPAMIEKATEDYPNQHWILFDADVDTLDDKFDILFSNAVIQWIPNHDELLQKFADLLTDSGVLAVQLPLFDNMPISKAISKIGKHSKWAALTQGLDGLFTFHSASYYYDQLFE